MKVAIVFDPDASLGTDSNDPHHLPRRQGEFIDSASVDILLIWREFGDQFEGGSRTHIIPAGAWENVQDKQISKILKRLGALR